MNRWLRYILFAFLGFFLGLFFLRVNQVAPERINLDSSSLWIQDQIPVTLTPYPLVKILFGGDMMFDRNVRQMAEKAGYENLLSPQLKQLLLENDLVVANLEGPITDNRSLSAGTGPGDLNNTRFTFDPIVASWLAEHNIFLVNLGNNHSLDFGVQGALTTQDYLKTAKVDYFGWIGAATEASDYNQILTSLELNGFKIGLVNYNQFGQQTFDSVIKAIDQLKDEVDYLIVYPHWGIEYAPTANAVITQQGREFIEAGAHLVIGTHPHVIQPYEDYLHGRIYYSLGNFIFDQYFQPEVKKGQLVQVILKRTETEATPTASFAEFEIMMESGQAIELANSPVSLETE